MKEPSAIREERSSNQIAQEKEKMSISGEQGKGKGPGKRSKENLEYSRHWKTGEGKKREKRVGEIREKMDEQR